MTSVLKREHPQIKLVGVFVNSPVDDVKSILETCSLDLAQLHGDETPEMLAQLAPHVFKAIRLSADFEADKRTVTDSSADFEADKRTVTDFVELRQGQVPVLLVDAAVKGVYGGSGVTADWSAAAELAKKFPLLLAGGLTPENVADAVWRVKPWGVDVASGVESSPGSKDAAKMVAFVKEVKRLEIVN
jgi:phosphoribosylanthranilate isomerase